MRERAKIEGWRERERDRERGKEGERECVCIGVEFNMECENKRDNVVTGTQPSHHIERDTKPSHQSNNFCIGMLS